MAGVSELFKMVDNILTLSLLSVSPSLSGRFACQLGLSPEALAAVVWFRTSEDLITSGMGFAFSLSTPSPVPVNGFALPILLPLCRRLEWAAAEIPVMEPSDQVSTVHLSP